MKKKNIFLLNYVSLEEQTITFSVPTKFLRDWIVNNYSDKIKSEAKNHVEKVDTIKFVVKPLVIKVAANSCEIPSGSFTAILAGMILCCA